MKKAKFSLTLVVRLDINCRDSNNPNLMKDFYQFLGEAGIDPATRGGSGGPGSHVAYYSAEDAKKIEAWLLEQKAKKVEYRY